MQPYDGSSLKILFLIIMVFAVGYLIPSNNNAVVSMIIRSAGITGAYIILTYFMNIVPEFHKYIPFLKSK